MNDFGRKLRQLRAESDLTQEELRRELNAKGYSFPGNSTISRWENGSRKPKMEVIEELEDILGANRGLLLRLAGYLVETSQEQAGSSQLDSVIVIQRSAHFVELADMAKSLLANGLESVSCPGWTTKRSRQVKYVIPSETADSGYDELTKEQLASRLNSNMDTILKEQDWLLRRCFIPHLKSELPQELKTDPFFKIVEKQPYELIEILRMLAARKVFKGTCPGCED